MTTPNNPLTPERIEEQARKFNNRLGTNLRPSNDTMEAVRLAKKEYEAELQTLQADFDKALEATEKAYGGCRKCYGKGYATVREEWTGRNNHIVDERPRPCSCDRGKQIKELLTNTK